MYARLIGNPMQKVLQILLTLMLIPAVSCQTKVIDYGGDMGSDTLDADCGADFDSPDISCHPTCFASATDTDAPCASIYAACADNSACNAYIKTVLICYMQSMTDLDECKTEARQALFAAEYTTALELSTCIELNCACACEDYPNLFSTP
jgi:hypothetical protein